MSVAAGVTLTIEPGAVVKFNANQRLSISGALNAAGSLGQEIVFTSYRDDQAGGDTNGDGPSAGQPGDWGRIEFLSQTNLTFTDFQHVVVRYGGSGNVGNVYLEQANVAVVSSAITESSSYGIRVYAASPLIAGTTVASNALSGIYLELSGTATIQANQIHDNQYGVYVASSASTPVIDGNTITNHTSYGVYFLSTSASPPITNNTIVDNTRGAILPLTAVPAASDNNVLVPNQLNTLLIRGNGRTQDLHLEVLSGGGEELSTYWVFGNARLNSGASLTVDPGVTVKFSSGSDLELRGGGTLTAEGTAALPIAFTSDRDDAHGGDTNGDGTGTAPANGDWRGLYVEQGASASVAHAFVGYGGSNGSANLYVYQTPSVTVADSTLSNSSVHGVRSYQSSVALSATELYGNASDGLSLEQGGTSSVTGGRIYANFSDGIELSGASALTVSMAEIFANVGAGLRNGGNQAVVAQDNFWGAPDGPSGIGPGAGDAVLNTSSGSVDVANFRTTGSSFSYFNAGPNLSEGTIAGPTVVQGTDTTEFGTSAATRMLYDLDRVILSYGSVPASGRYELLVTYYNPDDASGVGGSVQSLSAGPSDDVSIHGPVPISRTTPVATRYLLPAAAHAGGSLLLNAVRENGFRAVVSQVWLVERAITGDETAPVSSVASPAAGTQLASSPVEVTGTASDEVSGSGLAGVEVGIEPQGGEIDWRPATELAGDGSWRYRWNLPADGSYTLYARATDRAGNVEVPGAGVAVVVNRTAPAAPTGLTAHDTPSDAGGSITVGWVPSPDDGSGANDVASYEIARRAVGDLAFTAVAGAGAGSTSATDGVATDGVLYEYRVTAIDLAGNRGTSSVYGPVISIDNTQGDVTAPAEVTGLSATPGNGFAYLSWTRSADTFGGALDVVDQLLDLSTDGGANYGPPVSLGKETSFRLVDGLSNGQGYRARLRVQELDGQRERGGGDRRDAEPDGGDDRFGDDLERHDVGGGGVPGDGGHHGERRGDADGGAGRDREVRRQPPDHGERDAERDRHVGPEGDLHELHRRYGGRGLERERAVLGRAGVVARHLLQQR